MPAWIVEVKSLFGSVSIRSAKPSPRENRTSATASGSACSRSTPSRCASGEHPGHLFASAAHQAGVLDGDVGVATREGEQLEDQRDEVRIVAHGLLQVLGHQVDEVIGGLGGRELALRASPGAARSRA